MSASSTARSSAASRRPADRPSRWGSTTVVCSTRTRVCCCSSVMVGRKLAGRALVEVGATRTVLRLEELVGLDDNGVPGAALFVPAHVASSRQMEQLAPDHVSR